MVPHITRGTFGRIRRFARGDGVRMVFQPITDLRTGSVVGFESLARFDGTPERPTATWFDEAGAAGLRAELELSTARAAVAALASLPGDTFLTINASPDVAMDPAFIDAVGGAPPGRLVVEITEHAPIADYDSFNRALAEIRSRGARIAIDDAGAGFANMTHILRIDADLIKLDVELTRHIDIDARRRALVRSLVEFAGTVGSTLVAEGIETEAELEALRSLGVHCGQGYHLGRPAPLGGPAPVPVRRSPAKSHIPTKLADARSFLRMRSSARRASPRRRFPTLTAAVILIVLVLAPAALAVTEDALPGSPAYWVKRRIENVRLLVALDRKAEIHLHLTFARRRMNELAELVADGRTALTETVLAEYGRDVDAVERLLNAGDGSSQRLKARIIADLSDYVAGLDNERHALCGASGTRPGCGSAGVAAAQSKQVLDRVKGPQKPPHPSASSTPKPKPKPIPKVKIADGQLAKKRPHPL